MAKSRSDDGPFPDRLTSDEPGVTAAKTGVVIASSVRLVREGLVACLRDRDGIVVIDAVNLESDGIARVAAIAPDVVLVDLGHRDPREVTQLLKTACSEAKLVAFALAEIDDDVFACAAAGFSGYVPRESGADDGRDQREGRTERRHQRDEARAHRARHCDPIDARAQPRIGLVRSDEDEPTLLRREHIDVELHRASISGH